MDVPTTPTETMLRAIQDNRRLQRFIESLPITDDTNKLYRQITTMIDELWEAWHYTFSLI
jgi:hypothetical protein